MNAGGTSSPISEIGNDDAEAFDNIDTWAGRTWLNGFKNAGIESAYQEYVGHLWLDHFFRWTVVVAAVFSVSIILAILQPVIGGSVGGLVFHSHDSIDRGLHVLTGLLWAVVIASGALKRSDCKRAIRVVVRHQQLLMALITILVTATLTLPVLLASPEDIVRGYPSGVNGERVLSPYGYIDGKWHVAIPAVGAIVLSISGVSPLLFAGLSGVGFVLWCARNRVGRLAAFEARTDAIAAAANASYALAADLGNSSTQAAAIGNPANCFAPYLRSDESEIMVNDGVYFGLIWISLFFVCQQRDSLMRRASRPAACCPYPHPPHLTQRARTHPYHARPHPHPYPPAPISMPAHATPRRMGCGASYYPWASRGHECITRPCRMHHTYTCIRVAGAPHPQRTL